MPKRLTKDELISAITKVDKNFSLSDDYDFSSYKNNRSTIKLKHICGNTIESSLINFQEGKKKCPCEKKNLRRENYENREKIGRGKYLIRENYLNEIFTDPDYILAEDSDYKYSGCNKTPVKIKHLSCNTIFSMSPNSFQQGQRCPYCANLKRIGALPTYGVSQIKKYLDEKNMLLSIEKTFSDCRDNKVMPFDFEDIHHNIIEFDGEQHFNPTKRGYITSKKHDKMKNKYCENHKITILRIPFTSEKIIPQILDLFYNKNYKELKELDIYLFESHDDVYIHKRKYYNR